MWADRERAVGQGQRRDVADRSRQRTGEEGREKGTGEPGWYRHAGWSSRKFADCMKTMIHIGGAQVKEEPEFPG